MAVGEFNVDDGADDLNDFTDAGGGGGCGDHDVYVRIEDELL